MRVNLLIGLLLSAITLAVYWPVLNSGFVNLDDPHYVTNNPHVLTGLNWRNVEWSFQTGHASNWHPLTWLSHQLDAQLFGLKPGWHHLTSLIFHIANAVLLFALLQRMTNARWQSAFVAALFAVHPLHVESVAWVAERKDVLSTFFFMLTLMAYARYVESLDARNAQWNREPGPPETPHNEPKGNKSGLLSPTLSSGRGEGEDPGSSHVQGSNARSFSAKSHPGPHPFRRGEGESSTVGSRRQGAKERQGAQVVNQGLLRRLARSPGTYYALALLLFALGLMSKPMLVTLPFVLLLLDYWPLGRWRGSVVAGRLGKAQDGPWTLVREKLPFFALSIAASVTTFRVQGKTHAVFVGLPLEHRLVNAIACYLKYLGKAVWPTDLAIFYPHPGLGAPLSANPWTWQVLAAALILLVLSGCALLRLKDQPWFATGWFWYMGTLVPVIGIVQVGGQAMADRYTYIPLIGIFVMAAWTAPEIFSGFRWSKALLRFSALGVLLAGGALAHNQVKYWHDDISLFNHALAATRRNPMAHCNLGQNYAKQGKFDLAAIQLRAALEESPIFAEARVALAGVLDAQGKAQEALKEIELEVGITPWSGVAHNCLGAILQHLGRGAEARGQFEEAVRLEPDFPDARSNLGGILVLEGKLDEAIAQFSAALALDPRSEKAHFGLASALAGQGKRDKAILEYQTVLWLNPTHWNALNDLAWIRATASDARLRDGRDAVKLAEQACKLTEFREPLFIGTLAAAYAEAGRFDEAIKNAQKARALAYATGRKQLADRNQELLEFYLAGKPHREPPTKSKN